jgi:hypothetical protein
LSSIKVVESVEAHVTLSAEQAEALNRLGEQLASKATYWAQELDADEASQPSVIRCRPTLEQARWLLRVSDAIGMIVVGDQQIEVRPKIPPAHLLHLLQNSGAFPRIADTAAVPEPSSTLWTIVATASTHATERVLRRGLLNSYREERAKLKMVRGRPAPMPTAKRFYAGRIGAACVFEEFDEDTPFNRLLKAAAREVAHSRLLPDELRARARRMLLRMDHVGELLPGDFWTQPERRLMSYGDAIELAKHVLRRQGRGIRVGATAAWSFLVRTPEMVEAAIRNILRSNLDPRLDVRKKGKTPAGTTINLNPDLLFGHPQFRLADVKYKVGQQNWARPDLYEVVAFAAGFGCRDAAILDFASFRAQRSTAHVGDHRIVHIPWRTTEAPPAEAESDFVERVGHRIQGAARHGV